MVVAAALAFALVLAGAVLLTFHGAAALASTFVHALAARFAFGCRFRGRRSIASAPAAFCTAAAAERPQHEPGGRRRDYSFRYV